jgi:hypothetical protein
MTKFISLVSPTTNDDLFKKKRKWILDFYRDDNNKGFVDLKNELKKITLKFIPMIFIIKLILTWKCILLVLTMLIAI